MKIHSEFTRRGSSAVHLSLRPWLVPGLACFAAAIALLASHAVAQTPAAAPRELPAKTVPVPDTVSPQMRRQIAAPLTPTWNVIRSEEHTSELQSLAYLVCRLLLEKKKKKKETRT